MIMDRRKRARSSRTPRAIYKLEEARFFLGHLREEIGKGASSEPGVFSYYLSAFLSAARSVTWVLQKEAKDPYDAWFPNWRKGLPPGDREFLDYMVEQRNLEVKEGAAGIFMKRKPVPAELIPGVMIFRPPRPLSEAQAEAARKRGLPASSAGAWIMVPEWFFQIEGEPHRVVQVCERYLALLQRLLDDFDGSGLVNVEERSP